jgi:hypothetical protein
VGKEKLTVFAVSYKENSAAAGEQPSRAAPKVVPPTADASALNFGRLLKLCAEGLHTKQLSRR